jgi:hypothetical protein
MNPNEVVLQASDGTYVQNGSTIKGKLILTTQRIYFKAAKNGDSSSDREIYPDQIEDVLFFNEKLLFPNGLMVVTRDGKENRFLVKKRKSWSEKIVKMM